jgi:outer membrane protein assembly factor BamE (lipoprotein component of BamABCDE complex)
MGSVIRIVLAGALCVALAACSPIYRRHGYVPSDKDLEALVVGESTQEDVAFEVGRPSSIGVLTGSGWFFVGSTFRQSGIRAPQEINRQVVAITFDDAGVVQNIERFGLEDGEVIVISRRVTESNIEGLSFLRQLLGNIGNLSAADIVGSE